MEEHKNRLSTEDEPKESLTFTECCEGITAYLTEHPD